MLRNWQSHSDYQKQLIQRLSSHVQKEKDRLIHLDKAISKLYLPNLDNLLPIIKPLYPNLGRPAINQQGIIRSLYLCSTNTNILLQIGLKRYTKMTSSSIFAGLSPKKLPASAPITTYFDASGLPLTKNS